MIYRLNEWMDEEMKQHLWRWKKETERKSRFVKKKKKKPAPNQVRFRDFVTIANDSELRLALFVKQAGVTPCVISFMKQKIQNFPHLRVNRLRVFTKPVSWIGPQSKNLQDEFKSCQFNFDRRLRFFKERFKRGKALQLENYSNLQQFWRE